MQYSFLAFLSMALPAMAQVAPGPPPWTCRMASACNAAGCISLPDLSSFTIDGEANESAFLVNGRQTPFYRSLDEAEAAVNSKTVEGGLILLPADVADAVGFDVYGVWCCREGMVQYLRQDEFTTIICN